VVDGDEVPDDENPVEGSVGLGGSEGSVEVPADGSVPVDGVESAVGAPVSSANEIPGVVAAAAPIPRATASAPTRPMYLA